MPCLEKLKNVMKNLKSGQLDFIPVTSHMWIGAWTVLIGCISFIGYFMLIDVKGLERKHFWPLLSCCPYSCLEELTKITNTLGRLAVFQQISAGLLSFYKSKCYDWDNMSGPSVRWLSYYWPFQFTAVIVIVFLIVIYFTFQRSMIGNRTFR